MASPRPAPPSAAAPPPEPVEGPLPLLGGQPGPSSATVSVNRSSPPAASMRIVPPAGDTSIAFATRLSSTCSSRPGDRADRGRSVEPDREGHLVLVGERDPRVDPPGDDGPDVDGGRDPAGTLGARHLEQTVDQAGQPRDLGQGAGDVGLGVTPGRDLGLEVLEPEPQRRERRPQLVRRVGDEVLLRADEPLDLRGGVVEARRELGDLRRARRCFAARREVALTETRGGVDEPIDRDRHLTGEAEADHEHHEERDEPDADEHQPAPSDASVDERRRVRHAHRADDTVAGHDGDGEVEDGAAARRTSIPPPRDGATRPRISGRRETSVPIVALESESASTLPRAPTTITRPPVRSRYAGRSTGPPRGRRARGPRRPGSRARSASRSTEAVTRRRCSAAYRTPSGISSSSRTTSVSVT